MDSGRRESRPNGCPTATRAEGGSAERRPLRLLVGSNGGAGPDDARAFAGALAAATDVEQIVAAGDEADRLKERAATESADLIVLARASYAGATRSLPGAVGERALDGAPCAIAVVPPGLADSGVALRTIAAGYEGSRAAAIALCLAGELAGRTGASLLVLGAVDVSLGLTGYETRQPKDFEQARMERHLRRALESAPSTVPAESRLLFGPAGRMLVEAAEEADLLVLGSRGSYVPLHRLVLGKVAAEVLALAPCPTLVTPDD